MVVITISIEEYNALKRKEVVFDFEKAKIEKRVKDGSYVDDDTRLLYGVPSRTEMMQETLEGIREKLSEEKAAYHWEDVAE